MPSSNKIEALDRNMATPQTEGNLLWYDVANLGVLGKGWTDTAQPYDRLPAKAEGVVRQPVWDLSQHSAGLCVRFLTDATSISARWTLRFPQLAMDHMPATGVSGLDLYVFDDVRNAWRWVGLGRNPQFPQTTACLVGGLIGQMRLFTLYFPLYNGVSSVEIGVAPDATLAKAPPLSQKPICFYGTSIVQGGCASRAGMAYPAILGRRLNHPTINLGFSGNGQLEPEVAKLLAELDPSVYVLDPLPNNSPEQTRERLGPFVQTLRQARPATPIVMVEGIVYENAHALPNTLRDIELKNEVCRRTFEGLKGGGVKHLAYLPAQDLLGHDNESTVDGVHPTDVGFLRLADAIEPVVTKALESH